MEASTENSKFHESELELGGLSCSFGLPLEASLVGMGLNGVLIDSVVGLEANRVLPLV